MLEKQTTETLGQYITRLRIEKGYSQRKLASISGVSNTTIHRIECGETPTPDAPTLKALEDVLGLEEMTLLIAAGYYNDKGEISRRLGNEENLSKGDLNQIEKDLEIIMKEIKRDSKGDYASIHNNPNIDQEDMELFEGALRTALKIAQRINKKNI